MLTRKTVFDLALALLVVGALALTMRLWSFAKTTLFADILIWAGPTLTYALFAAERSRRLMRRVPVRVRA